jgi:hypothetical protein
MAVMAIIAARETRAPIRAYSMAEAPDSSLKIRVMAARFIGASLSALQFLTK